MKNSRIILGVSAAVLAIASAFTTKSSNKMTSAAYIYSAAQSSCIATTTECTGSNVTCKTSVSSRTLFTSPGNPGSTNCSGVAFKHN